MKIRYTYKAYPDCPEATEYSRSRASTMTYLGMASVLLSITAVVLLVVYTFALFESYRWGDFLGALAFCILMAAVNFYLYVCRPRNTECELSIILSKHQFSERPPYEYNDYCKELRKENREEIASIAKIYFYVFFHVLIILLSLLGIVKGVYFLCHQRNGLGLLLGSLSVFAIFIILLVRKYIQHHRDSFSPCVSTKDYGAENRKHIARISSLVLYVGFAAFLLFNFKMFPETVPYLVSAGSVSLMIWLIHKLRGKYGSKKLDYLALVFGLCLIVSSVVLRIIYESKVDYVLSSVPPSGTVHLDIEMDEEFYSDTQELFGSTKIIREPTSSILLDGEIFEDGSMITVDINKSYQLRVNAGYQGESGVADSSNHGYVYTEFVYTPNEIINAYSTVVSIPLENNEHADVSISFIRTCTFWEVIFY